MKSRVDLVSLGVAVGVTLAACAALFGATGRVLRQYVGSAATPVALLREQVAFVTTRAPDLVGRATGAPSVAPRAVRAGTAAAPPAPVATIDTGASRIVPSKVAPQSLVPPARPPTYVRRSILPPAPRNPFIATVLTREERDSMLRELRDSVARLSMMRTMTQSERDSLMRVMATNNLVPGRAAQMPGYPPPGGLKGGGIIAAPLFSSGPSPAERRRDSAANVEYLARLRRLQERVQAKRESIRVADSMSRARSP